MTVNLEGYLGPGRTQEKYVFIIHISRLSLKILIRFLPPEDLSKSTFPPRIFFILEGRRNKSNFWESNFLSPLPADLWSGLRLFLLLAASLLSFMLLFHPLDLVIVFLQVYFPKPRTNRRVEWVWHNNSREYGCVRVDMHIRCPGNRSLLQIVSWPMI